jgi:O-antigen ligase
LIIIFKITLQTKKKADVLYYNKALIIALGINIIIGLWEVGTGNHLVKLEGEKNIEYYSNKALGVFGNGNDFSTFLYFGVVALFINLFYEKRHKLLCGLMIVASLFLILVINSRGTIYGIAIFFIALPICYFLIKHTNRSVLTVLVCIFALGLIVILLRYPLSAIVYRFSSSGNYGSDMYRIGLINGSLKLLEQSYFLGVGPGQSSNQLGMNPHNFFIELLADYGIFVFTGIIILFLRLLFSLQK